MNALRCPYRDRLFRQLVDSSKQLEKGDKAGVLVSTEVRVQVEAINLIIAEHRMSCPVCLRIDRSQPGVERSAFNASKQEVPPRIC